MQRADLALCSWLFVSLSPGFSYSWYSVLRQLGPHSEGAWGILPAWHAYKVGELTSPCICSSFSPAFVAGTISNHIGHSKNCQGYEAGANNSPTIREDWQVSCVRHALANRQAFTRIQKTDLARMHYRTFQLTVCFSLKKKAPIFQTQRGMYRFWSSRWHYSLQQKSWNNSFLNRVQNQFWYSQQQNSMRPLKRVG